MGAFNKMFENSTCNTSPQIQDLITVLTRQEDFGHESRSVPRETIVCPVTIQPQYELARFRGFTKDISSGGVCLITQTEIKVEQIATLAIYRADDLPTKIRARCIWQKSFGNDYYQSGWRFLRRVLQNVD